MGLSVGNKVYKSSATYLDSEFLVNGKADVGYHNISDNGIKKLHIGTDIQSVYEIVKSGYYRISLGNLRKSLFNTFSGIMLNTKLPDNSKVLIHIPEDYLMLSPESSSFKRYLGYLALTQYYPSTLVNSSALANIYSLLNGQRVPYIAPDRLKKCVFTSSTKHGVIGYSWSASDVDKISKLEIPDNKTGKLVSVDFYMINPDSRITVYIEGYGMEIKPTNNACFIGNDNTLSGDNILIYESSALSSMKLANKDSLAISSWGYTFPEVTIDSDSKVIGWSESFVPEVGAFPSDNIVTKFLPYDPNIYTIFGEMPANKLAYIPLTFDFDIIGTTASISGGSSTSQLLVQTDNIGRDTIGSRLPLGYYLFDRDNYSDFNYRNLAYTSYTGIYSFEVVNNISKDSVIQMLYETSSSMVYRVRTGMAINSGFTWKGWAPIGC